MQLSDARGFLRPCLPACLKLFSFFFFFSLVRMKLDSCIKCPAECGGSLSPERCCKTDVAAATAEASQMTVYLSCKHGGGENTFQGRIVLFSPMIIVSWLASFFPFSLNNVRFMSHENVAMQIFYPFPNVGLGIKWVNGLQKMKNWKKILQKRNS